MAKVGEGDPRWIVSDRPDGQNVNAWHWVEKDISDWAKKRLTELLDKAPLFELTVCKCTLSSVTAEGECTVYNRKGKISYLMDFNVSCNWSGEVVDSNGEVLHSCKGKFSCELEHDTTLEKLHIEVKVEKDGIASVVEAVKSTGREAIKSRFAVFYEELKQGYNLADSKKKTEGNASPTQQKEKKEEGGITQFTQTIEWRAPPPEIWDCLTNPQRASAYTRSQAKIVPATNGEFSFLNESITGTYIEVVPLKKLDMKWRLKDWKEGHVSNATITLDSYEEGTTLMSLKHTNVPTMDLERTQEGWKRNFWEPIQMLFGYGLTWK
eukprot:NODE_3464_length_1346_cov_146.645135_g3025_i0.p1 GENE.NODE_3464_length_1346_cov_146.645135_g3025_i0~~NODE_3464_length_1346_cov_146.645135_g3025_i0.p1  ORF type:complete len:323 (-),score=58.46 NODE_3464_length_1346_cov_146.645135_g3025_i0:322-1290(-)